MRKGVSILFSLVLLLSGAHFTVATHFCGGEIAARRLTLSGKLATCGMEGSEGSCRSSENKINFHCCDNKVVTIGIINNFNIPVSLVNDEPTQKIQAFSAPVHLKLISLQNHNIIFNDTGPPGEFSASAVKLNYICTFRI